MGNLKRNAALILIALMAIPAFAGVNLKNGNFYISYTYIDVPGSGKNLSITSTYNSKSTEVGSFGFGRGYYYDTKIVTNPDGCAIVHEHGAGGTTRFCPQNKVDPVKASQKIVDTMKKSSSLTAKAEKDLMERLTNNAELRHVYARRYKVSTDISAGSTLYSNQRGIQELQVTKDGFVRKSNDGKVEYFDNQGQLSKIKEKNGYSISFTYKDGKVFSIKDSAAKQIYFSWYANGLVKELWSVGDKKAKFKYDENKNLIYSVDVDGNEYGYSYDANHNLTKVVYNPDPETGKVKKGEKEDSIQMEYDPKTFFITKKTERNGDVTEYKYGNDPKRPKDHYWTLVTKKGFNNRKVTNRYEYEIKTRPDGSRYTYRILTQINGIKTETIYSECCGLPLKIARGKNVTNFEYNDKGLLTKKTSSKGDSVSIKYDDKHNKISEVKNASGITKFKYDAKGNLTLAENSRGKKVLLVYNSKGKISKMVDKDSKSKQQRVLAFTYNALGKPVRIEMEKIGTINVSYNNFGEIKKVESKQGHKMALQVTQAFQNLLAIVKPAGVNLNM